MTSEASEFFALGDITYSYHDDNFQFHFTGASPHSNYQINSGTLDFVIEKTADSHNISISSGIGGTLSGLVSGIANSIYNFVRNFLVVSSFGNAANWFDKSSSYGWEYHFTDFDENYPGHETYGTAYGFRFVGLLGESIDVVLDQYGDLYGNHPIGNLTFSDGQQDLADWSADQEDDGDVAAPSYDAPSFGEFKAPFIIGRSLYFYFYRGGDVHEVKVEDFNHAVVSFQTRSSSALTYIFVSWLDNLHTTENVYVDGVLKSSDNGRIYVYEGPHSNITRFPVSSWTYQLPNNPDPGSVIFPTVYNLTQSYANFNWQNPYTIYAGMSNFVLIQGTGDIWLDVQQVSPSPNPIVIPVDEPIPVDDIPGDPIVFSPDPEPDPDPVPGIDYPVPGPVPIPVPPIPPIVSGNDDLWPDLNITFDIEDSLLNLTSNLGNFEWPQFSGLIGNFTNALIWVSTIMTTLYEGTGFSVLFDVLAVFFIAAALFGLYKWWNK